MFATEAVLISEQITEGRFGALLEISDLLSSKLKAKCSAGLINILESFRTILYDFEKHSGVIVLLEMP